MGDLLIKNIPDAIRQSLEERAERAGTSLSEEVASVLREALLLQKPAEVSSKPSALRSLRDIMLAEDQKEAELYSNIMESIEAERKSDFGRPVEHLE